MITVLDEREPVARKRHRCDYCLQAIMDITSEEDIE